MLRRGMGGERRIVVETRSHGRGSPIIHARSRK
jgi:hypothetical protein